MTAQTPTASTVHHPYGSPSGPGLFHVKGLQLPAYIQNVAHALQRTGSAKSESEAIEIAVGVVKRWAAGIGAKGKKVHPDVQAAAAKAVTEWEAAKARAHAHANEDGAAMTLTDGIDLATVELGSYIAPHVPAGSPKGGQFGTTSGGGKGTPAQQHAAHDAHMAHLQHLVDTGKATPAQKKELAGLLAGKQAGYLSSPQFKQALAAVKASAVAPKAKKPKKPKKAKAPAKPKVNKTKGTVTTTIGGKKVTVTLRQWHNAHVAHLQHLVRTGKATAAQKAELAAKPKKAAKPKAAKPAVAKKAAASAPAVAKPAVAKLAGGDGQFLELAFTEALAERVPPGRREGGRFAPVAVQLSRHDTRNQAAKVINAMQPVQRAVVRASTLPPPGFSWGPADRLTVAQ